MNWKLYVDSREKRAIDLCGGSMDKGDGLGVPGHRGDSYGRGYGYGHGSGQGHGNGDGYGWGYGYGNNSGDGTSASWWK